jgi:tRNA(Ile)-lysidine synthase
VRLTEATAKLEAAGDGLIARVFEILDRRLEAGSASPIAVAVSGGGDSVALLALAAAWGRLRGRPVLALSVDHGLQPQSPAWTAFARDAAARLGAAWRGLNWTGSKPTVGLPAAARRARHALIAEAAREAGAGVVLFAHTLDDVAEGEVMRAEGSTLGRLREWGPSPAWPLGREVFLLRPLLRERRKTLRELLTARGLSWIEDPANDDERYARPRARKRLAAGAGPALAQEAADEAAMEVLAIGALASQVDQAGVIWVARTPGPPPPAAFLAIALLCASGRTRPPRGDQVARLRERLRAGETFTATLAGARVEANEEDIRFLRDAGETTRGGLAPVRVEPGRASIWDGRFEVAHCEAGEIRPLKGLAASLTAGERLAISRFSPAARPALPVLIGDADLSPVLASQVAGVRCLVGGRLRAACGVVAQEAEIVPFTRGAGARASLC